MSTPRSEIRTVIEVNGHYGFTVAAKADEVLYRSPLHLDEKSARGYLIDLRNALNTAQCLWCGDHASFISEVDGLEVFAFCSTECEKQSLIEVDAELQRADQ